MMMAFARQLPKSLTTQIADRHWSAVERRAKSFLLNGQIAIIVGFGEIAVRLCELLAPFQMQMIGVRRRIRGGEPIRMINQSQLFDFLPLADHVINLLPANASSSNFFGATEFATMKQEAYFYNIGRGATVDQGSLESALRMGTLAGAYLDVTSPEPLPNDHPLWTTPNCYITPHTAGGYNDEMMGLVNHFEANLRRFLDGIPLLNQVI